MGSGFQDYVGWRWRRARRPATEQDVKEIPPGFCFDGTLYGATFASGVLYGEVGVLVGGAAGGGASTSGWMSLENGQTLVIDTIIII